MLAGVPLDLDDRVTAAETAEENVETVTREKTAAESALTQAKEKVVEAQRIVDDPTLLPGFQREVTLFDGSVVTVNLEVDWEEGVIGDATVNDGETTFELVDVLENGEYTFDDGTGATVVFDSIVSETIDELFNEARDAIDGRGASPREFASANLETAQQAETEAGTALKAAQEQVVSAEQTAVDARKAVDLSDDWLSFAGASIVIVGVLMLLAARSSNAISQAVASLGTIAAAFVVAVAPLIISPSLSDNMFALAALALAVGYVLLLFLVFPAYRPAPIQTNRSGFLSDIALLVSLGFLLIIGGAFFTVIADRIGSEQDDSNAIVAIAAVVLLVSCASALLIGRWVGKGTNADYGWRLGTQMMIFAERYPRVTALWVAISPWNIVGSLFAVPLILMGQDAFAGFVYMGVGVFQVLAFLAIWFAGLRNKILAMWVWLWSPNNPSHDTAWTRALKGISIEHRRNQQALRHTVQTAINDASGTNDPIINRWWVGLSESTLDVVAPPSEKPLLVIGSTGSGKTSSVVLQNAMLHDGAIVATSTKSELMEMLTPGLLENGRYCCVFDPLGTVENIPEGVHQVSWNVLSGCGDWDKARQRASLMVSAASSGDGVRSDGGAFWEATASNVLAALLYGCDVTSRDVADLIEVMSTLGDIGTAEKQTAYGKLVDEIYELFMTTAEGRHKVELSLCRGVLIETIKTVNSSGNNSSSLRLTVSRALSSLRSAAALEILTSGTPPLNIENLISSESVLFLVSETAEQELTAPLFVGLIDDIVQHTYMQHRRGSTRETLLLLDELAQLAPLKTLPSLIAEGRGKGLRMLAILQDLSQAERVWGHEGLSFPSKFPHMLILPGLRDKQLLDTLEAIGGRYDRWYTTYSYTSGESPSSTTTENKERLSNLEPGDISALPKQKALLFSTGNDLELGWTKLWLTPHYETQPPQPWGDFIEPYIDTTEDYEQTDFEDNQYQQSHS